MPTLLERLQGALRPQFTVDREIATGGMGRVFAGHDVALDRPVAIKVLRPELATAVGVERFLREARILARLRHPNIVPVFQGGEADGLLYHVLELQRGETLARRLERGPLSRTEFEVLADGLLAALGAAHEAGVVHRDIKPGNIFLEPGRAVVGDFGIAATVTSGEPLTESGATPGTRAYMAPEQLRGGATTPRTDLYAAGLVLFEALAGRRPDSPAAGGPGSWAAVPRRLARPLRRALAEDPAARWPDAGSMRAVLRGGGTRRPAVLAGVAAIAAAGIWLLIGPASRPARFTVGIAPLVDLAPGPGGDWADSVRGALAARLRGFADFRVEDEAEAGASVRISGTVERRGDSLRTVLFATGGRGRARPLPAPAVPLGSWRSLVDSLALEVLVGIWRDDLGEGSSLPRGALPLTPAGMAAWLQAELAYGDGEWAEARGRYEDAIALDAGCLLCAYRIRDLDRWLNRGSDTARLGALLAGLERFPPEYQDLISASALPVRNRIAALQSQAEERRDFFDLQYLLGDELLHRGPLVGVPRHAAIEALRTAHRLRPDFAGVAEHLAWALIAEGQAEAAREVLDGLARSHPPRDAYTAGLRLFHELAWRWRFAPPADARAFTAQQLADPAVLGSPDLPAGPRALPALGVMAGAVGLGRALESLAPAGLVRAGLVARLFGHAALGQFLEAGRSEAALRAQSDDPEWRLVPLQLQGLLVLAGLAVGDGPEAPTHLDRLARRSDLPSGLRARIGWTVAMRAPPAPPARTETPLDLLLQARHVAARGNPAGALSLTDSLTPHQYRLHDPSAGAAARLLRASWYGQLGRHAEAARELLWHEHSDFVEIPRDRVQAAEFDWALGTAAMWLRAGHLEAEGELGRELCRAYSEVARHWDAADPSLLVRRDSARARLAVLGCEVGR